MMRLRRPVLWLSIAAFLIEMISMTAQATVKSVDTLVFVFILALPQLLSIAMRARTIVALIYNMALLTILG